MKKKIKIGDVVYYETLDGKTDSMVVHEIVRDKLYDENGAFLTKEEITKVVHSEESPLPSHEDRAVTWLKTQFGKVITKKLINEFIKYMSNENI